MDDLGIYEMKSKQLSCIIVDNLSIKPHLHLEWECIVCYSGHICAHINDLIYEINPGEMLLVPPKSIHYYDAKVGEYAVIIFNSDSLSNMKKEFEFKRPQNFIADYTSKKELYDIVGKIKEYSQSDYLINAFLDPKLFNGILIVLMYFAIDLFNFIEISRGTEKLCDKIITFCSENYMDDITLEMLSKELNTSQSRISHIFNGEMRMSIVTFVNWIRIAEACRLLRKTDMAVTEIAYEVGFSSLRTLNRTFQKFMFQTPLAYRRTVN